MWFLPLLLVGAIAMAVASRSSREPIPPSRQLSAPPPPNPSTPSGPSGLPGPISVLGEILRVGQAPPPTVILCAIAEAQAIGRNDLASDIVHAFVVPVVNQRMHARGDRSYERGSCAVIPSPRQAAEAATWSAPPPVAPSASAPSVPSMNSVPSLPVPSTGDEISALLNADAVRFMDL